MRNLLFVIFLGLSTFLFGKQNTEISIVYQGADLNAIHTDENGLIWLLTDDGIQLYDGYQFHLIKIPDSNNIGLNEKLSRIEPDTSNSFWFALKNRGLVHYNVKTNAVHYFSHDAENSNTLASNEVHSLYKDSSGLLWIGLFRKGISVYDTKKHSFKHLTFHQPEFNASENARLNQINAIIPDKVHQEFIWLITARGLIRIHRETFEYEQFYSFNQPTSLIEESQNHAYQDKDGSLWIGSWGAGLYHFNPETKDWNRYLYEEVKQFAGTTNVILHLARKSEEELWVSTTKMGLGTFHIPTKTFYFLESNPYNKRAEAKEAALWLSTDKQGNNWIHYSNKLGLIRNRTSAFKYVPMEQYLSEKNRFFMITDATWEKGKLLTTGFFADGVYERNGDQWTTYKILNKTISRLPQLRKFVRFNDTLYAFGKGTFFRVDAQHQTLTQLNIPLEPAFYRRLYTDGKKFMYFGSRWKGIFQLNMNTRKIRQIDLAQKHDGFYIGDIDADSKGNIWAAHDNGITIVNPNTFQTSNYAFQDTVYGNIRFQNLSQIVKWKDNYMLLASHNGGLVKVHEDSLSFRALHPMNYILDKDDYKIKSIEQNTDGTLWILTNKKLLAFDENLNRKGSFIPSDGLPEADQLWHLRMFHQDSILISCRYGALFINTKQLFEKDYPAKALLTGIQVMNSPYSGVQNSGFIEQLQLNYNKNFITFQLSPIQFSNPEKNKIRWKLEGIDLQWNEKTGPCVASYTALPPGKYTFLYQAANHQGNWSDTVKELPVIIHPPFWKTIWFQAIVFFLILLFLTLAYLIRVRQIQRRERLKHQYEKALTEMEIKALRAQMNPHFLFNSLNSVKHFLISGEIKNGVQYINKFSRLLRLILNHSQLTEVALKDEIRFLELYLQIEQIRFDQSFKWNIDIAPNVNTEKVAIPPMSIQPFVENAIWHGLMHKEGERILNLSVQLNKHDITIVIQDNGIGREKARALKSKSAVKDKSLGMEMTKQRLKLLSVNQGEKEPFIITDLTDKKGNSTGTLVTITIPVKPYTYVESNHH